MKAGFADWNAALDTSDFPWDANWMSPGDSDPEVAEARAEARSLLQTVGNWESRVAKMGESFRSFREPRRQPPKWIGWVAREDDRYVALLQSADAQGRLFVLACGQPGGATQLVEIGAVTGGSQVSIEDTAAQVVGAPVCLFPTTEATARRAAAAQRVVTTATDRP
jgi:hypothetical protein